MLCLCVGREVSGGLRVAFFGLCKKFCPECLWRKCVTVPFTRLLLRIGDRDILNFTMKLKFMVASGIPITDALEIIGTGCKNRHFSRIVYSLLDSVSGGNSLSSAVELYKNIFGRLYHVALRVGEETGKFEEVLGYLCVHIEKVDGFKRKVKSLTVYPAFVFMGTVFFLFTVALALMPSIVSVYNDAGLSLPPYTRAVIVMIDAVKNRFYLVVLLVFLLLFVFSMFLRVGSFRLAFDRKLVGLPILGEILMKYYLSVFSKSMSLLLSCGTDMLSSIKLSSMTVVNLFLKELFDNVCSLIESGYGISEAFSAQGVFPKEFVGMILSAENSGSFPEMFGRTAEIYSLDVDSFFIRAAPFFEVFLVLFVGIFAGLALVAMYLPLFELGNAIG